MRKKRIKHNDLTHYFMTSHEHLPASYLASCEKFFKWLEDCKKTGFKAPSNKQKASSFKQQAGLDSSSKTCYRILKEKL